MELKRKKQILFWIGFGLLVIVFLIFLAFVSIYSDVKSTCLHAQRSGDDCVESLIYTTKSTQSDFKQKNTAIWTLGQLADQRAIAALTELSENLPDDFARCDYGEMVCPSEIFKALHACQTGNITSWMYRKQVWIK
jgi:hypothetical protein